MGNNHTTIQNVTNVINVEGVGNTVNIVNDLKQKVGDSSPTNSDKTELAQSIINDLPIYAANIFNDNFKFAYNGSFTIPPFGTAVVPGSDGNFVTSVVDKVSVQNNIQVVLQGYLQAYAAQLNVLVPQVTNFLMGVIGSPGTTQPSSFTTSFASSTPGKSVIFCSSIAATFFGNSLFFSYTMFAYSGSGPLLAHVFENHHAMSELDENPLIKNMSMIKPGVKPGSKSDTHKFTFESTQDVTSITINFK